MSVLARLVRVRGEDGCTLSLEIEQDRGGEVAFGLRVAMCLASQSRQIAANPVVHAFDGVRVRFASEVLGLGDDSAVAVVVGGVSELIAARKRLAQRSGCSGVAITQRPAEYLVGSAINSPPEPNWLFFLPT